MNSYKDTLPAIAPDAQDFLGGNYLQKEEIEKPTVVTIMDVKAENIPGRTRKKLVVSFREFDKPLILNKTNTRELSVVFQTTNTASWRGRQLTLCVDPTVEFGGKRVGGIRVRPASNGKAASGYHGSRLGRYSELDVQSSTEMPI